MSAPLSHIVVFFLPLLLLLPPFILLRYILFHSWKRTAVYYFFALYLCALWVFFGLPDCLNGAFTPELSLIPFAEMIRDPLGAVFGFALFLPYGIMLPLCWKRFRDGWKALPAGFFLALFLSLAQLFSPKKISSVDTLILGALGTWVGYFISCVLILSNPRMDETAPADGTFPERILTFAAVVLVMIFLFPLARLAVAA